MQVNLWNIFCTPRDKETLTTAYYLSNNILSFPNIKHGKNNFYRKIILRD